MTSQIWEADFPAEKVGGWDWKVSVVWNGATVATSSEWKFWFDPFILLTPTSAVYPTPTFIYSYPALVNAAP